MHLCSQTLVNVCLLKEDKYFAEAAVFFVGRGLIPFEGFDRLGLNQLKIAYTVPCQPDGWLRSFCPDKRPRTSDPCIRRNASIADYTRSTVTHNFSKHFCNSATLVVSGFFAHNSLSLTGITRCTVVKKP